MANPPRWDRCLCLSLVALFRGLNNKSALASFRHHKMTLVHWESSVILHAVFENLISLISVQQSRWSKERWWSLGQKKWLPTGLLEILCPLDCKTSRHVLVIYNLTECRSAGKGAFQGAKETPSPLLMAKMRCKQSLAWIGSVWLRGWKEASKGSTL